MPRAIKQGVEFINGVCRSLGELDKGMATQCAYYKLEKKYAKEIKKANKKWKIKQNLKKKNKRS
jgi:hypothetical protein